jgi:hypothetical protein
VKSRSKCSAPFGASGSSEPAQPRFSLSHPDPDDGLSLDVPGYTQDGARCVAVLESVVKSKKEKGWVKVASVR